MITAKQLRKIEAHLESDAKDFVQLSKLALDNGFDDDSKRYKSLAKERKVAAYACRQLAKAKEAREASITDEDDDDAHCPSRNQGQGD